MSCSDAMDAARAPRKLTAEDDKPQIRERGYRVTNRPYVVKMMPNFTHSTKEYLSGTYHMSSTVLSMGICIWKEKAPVLREHQFRAGNRMHLRNE